MQLERLKSPNKDTRYEACEELRVAESIPPEAIAALELAAKDEDALVADAARRALLTHRPLRSPGQADDEMTKQVHVRGRCPNCGRNELTIDKRSADKLSNAFDKRASASFLAWLGAFVLIFLQFPPTERLGWLVFFALALLGFAVTLLVVIRAHRQVYGPGAANRYPGARYACRACGNEWTTPESRTSVTAESDEPKASADQTPQETTGKDQPPGAEERATPDAPRGWRKPAEQMGKPGTPACSSGDRGVGGSRHRSHSAYPFPTGFRR
jgi:predicted RNA-binding Zn-ribbon protein involved in translation (DUF1610 family)